MENTELIQELDKWYSILFITGYQPDKTVLDSVRGALSKQIPVKAKHINYGNITLLKCPRCACRVNTEYCTECGQRIDWSEK